VISYGTFFYAAHVPRAEVWYRTLRRWAPTAPVFALVQDEAAAAAVRQWTNARAIPHAELEAAAPALAAKKAQRTSAGYAVSLRAALVQYLFDEYYASPVCVTDSDVAFLGPVAAIEDELRGCSFYFRRHDVPRAEGYYNSGLGVFRDDANTRQFLTWWQAQCVTWCEWQLDRAAGRFGDQLYLNVLDDHPEQFPRHRACRHPGINLGPWCAMQYQYQVIDGLPHVVHEGGCVPLVCYHYHWFVPEPGGGYRLPGGYECPDVLHELVYRPYLRLLDEAKCTSK